jgi:hypothetical protein
MLVLRQAEKQAMCLEEVSMTKTTSSEQVQVNFRMPVELRDRLRAASQENHRSLNAEIVARLEYAFAGERLEANLPATSRSAQANEADDDITAKTLQEIERRLAASEAQLANMMDRVLAKIQEQASDKPA